MSKVVKIVAYEMLHQGARPTIAARLTLDNGREVETSVATADHAYDYQAQQLLDNDTERYLGSGVLRAVHYINTLIGPKLAGVSPTKQNEVDGWLLAADGTPDKSKLGVNTIYAISSLFLKAGAVESGLSLFEYINNYYNARHSETSVKIEKVSSPIIPMVTQHEYPKLFDFREFCVVPSSSYTFSKALEIAMSIYLETRRRMKSAIITGNIDVINTVTSATDASRLKLASDIFLAISIKATNFYQGSNYNIKEKNQPVKASDYLDFLSNMSKKYYPLFLIDPVVPDDLPSWKALGQTINENAYLAGDDLIGSNSARLTKMLDEKVCTSFFIKPPEVGTITEVSDLVNILRKHNLNYALSTSLYETNDSLLSDLSVAMGGDFVKFGLPTYGEHFSKYNRMVEIENEILGRKKV